MFLLKRSLLLIQIILVSKALVASSSSKKLTESLGPIYKDLNLGFIQEMKKKYNKAIIGHSDHTNNIFSSISAVALGARIIEKHVYLNNLNSGPDRDVSISFTQLKELINQIRFIEKGLGKEKKVYQLEKKIRSWAHRSIVTTKFIPKNKIIKKEDIWSKRPGTGIPSRYMKNIIGKRAKKNLKKNKLVFKKDIS